MNFLKNNLLFFILSTFLAINIYASETSDQATTKINDAKQTLQQQNPSFLKRNWTRLKDSIKKLANASATFIDNHPRAYILCILVCYFGVLSLKYYFEMRQNEKLHEENEKWYKAAQEKTKNEKKALYEKYKEALEKSDKATKERYQQMFGQSWT